MEALVFLYAHGENTVERRDSVLRREMRMG